jgi:Ca2+-binding RTX toxin-like protein
MRNRNQGMVESLEARRLMSGAVLGTGGVLRVWGDELRANTITLSNNGDDVQLDVTVTSRNAAGEVVKTLTRSFIKANVSSVAVLGGMKDDIITASTGNGGFAIAMRVVGRAGNDRITTGDGADLVLGGGGNDTLTTRGGNDRVFGLGGDDIVDSGSGDDRVSGGLGNDRLSLNSGNDFARGDAGNDEIRAGTGDDVVFGCGGIDELFGEANNDTLWGGVGDDMLWGGDGNDILGGVLGANSLMGEAGANIFVVRRLDLNPSNDFSLASGDTEQRVTTTTEGPTVPVV